ncbi:orotate phosphoribosyltransferase [archaeon]|nr:orotate phosphoribosyltransferase [archaeon]
MPLSLAECKERFIDILVKIRAVRFGTFMLSSGAISPYYIDLRLIPSYPDLFVFTCRIYKTLIKRELGVNRFHYIASIPTAGLIYAAAIAHSLRKPLVYVRKEVKQHGRERLLEGALRPGSTVLVLDDLATTGRSIYHIAMCVKSEGGLVRDAVVLIDRQEGARELLVRHRIQLHPLMTVKEIAEALFARGAISEEQYETILNYVESVRKGAVRRAPTKAAKPKKKRKRKKKS